MTSKLVDLEDVLAVLGECSVGKYVIERIKKLRIHALSIHSLNAFESRRIGRAISEAPAGRIALVEDTDGAGPRISNENLELG